MKIIQLRCFIILCETLSFSQTGEILHLTQPAISHQIKKLESLLRFQLFVRTNHKVELTPAGKQFYYNAKEFLARLQIGINEATLINRGKHSVIKIGYEGHNVEAINLPRIISDFTHANSDTQIMVLRTNHKERKNALLSGVCDIIMTVKDDIENTDGVVYKEIMDEGVICLVNKASMLTSKERLNLEDICEENIILLDSNHGPKEWNVVQQRIISSLPDCQFIFSDSISSGEIYIKSNMGVAIIPSFCTPSDSHLAHLPLDINETLSYGVAYLKNSANPNVIKLSKFIHQQFILPVH
ncbi:TPA: LysR family transcriptional regulator [Klebsiella pneumoniae]